jgi:hypothetical protein
MDAVIESYNSISTDRASSESRSVDVDRGGGRTIETTEAIRLIRFWTEHPIIVAVRGP